MTTKKPAAPQSSHVFAEDVTILEVVTRGEEAYDENDRLIGYDNCQTRMAIVRESEMERFFESIDYEMEDTKTIAKLSWRQAEDLREAFKFEEARAVLAQAQEVK